MAKKYILNYMWHFTLKHLPLEEVDVGNAANVIAKWKDSYLKNDIFNTRCGWVWLIIVNWCTQVLWSVFHVLFDLGAFFFVDFLLRTQSKQDKHFVKIAYLLLLSLSWQFDYDVY